MSSSSATNRKFAISSSPPSRKDGSYRVSRARFGDEALSLLERDRPNLAIIDAMPEDISGIEFAMRALGSAVPILVMTDEPAMEVELARLGLDCLHKPFALDALLERSRALIAEARKSERQVRASLKGMTARLEALRNALDQVRDTMGRVRSLHKTAPRSPAPPRYDFRTDGILREMLAYWERQRGSRAMPRRRDIDPTELPRRALPHLQLIDVIDDGGRFCYRLVGTAIVDVFGAEFTGKHVDELDAGDRVELAHGFYRTVCATRKPVFVRSRYATAKAVDVIANRLLMPLSKEGEQVNIILGVLTFEPLRPLPRGGGHRAQIDPFASYIDIIS